MELIKEILTEQNLLLKIKLEADDYLPEVKKSLKDYAKKVNLKGFRSGKVPTGIIKKMYGKEILAEEINKLINQKLNDYIRDEKLNILGDPIPGDSEEPDFSVDSLQDYEFEFELGLQPEFDLSYIDNNPETTKHVIKIDDELIGQEMEQMQKRFGKMNNPDTVMNSEDVLYVELQELDNNGNPLETGLNNSVGIPIPDFKGKTLKSKLEKSKTGDVHTIELFKSFDKDRHTVLHDYFNIHDHGNDIQPKFRMEIKNINHVEPAEINEELFEKVYGQSNVKTVEEFKEKIKKELGVLLDTYSEQMLNNDIVKDLTEKIDMQFPEPFLKKWLKKVNDAELTDQQIETDFAPFVRNLKWTLTVNKVMKENEITISRENIESRTKELIKMEYGLSDDSGEINHYIDEISDQLMAKEDHVNKVYEGLRDTKVFEILKEKYKIKDKAISYDKFKELNKK